MSFLKTVAFLAISCFTLFGAQPLAAGGCDGGCDRDRGCESCGCDSCGCDSCGCDTCEIGLFDD